MKLCLLNFKVPLFFAVLAIAANNAVAQPFSLSTTCSLPAFVPDKCMLTTRFVDVGSTKTQLTKVRIQVLRPNSKAYVDISNSASDAQDPNNGLAALSNVYNIMVTCDKSYRVRVNYNFVDGNTKTLFSRYYPSSTGQVATCPKNNL